MTHAYMIESQVHQHHHHCAYGTTDELAEVCLRRKASGLVYEQVRRCRESENIKGNELKAAAAASTLATDAQSVKGAN